MCVIIILIIIIMTILLIQLLLVIDGCDVYDYQVDLPSSSVKQRDGHLYIAGGVVSSHTQEKHIQLMHADQTQLSWKLGSMHVFEGLLLLLLLLL